VPATATVLVLALGWPLAPSRLALLFGPERKSFLHLGSWVAALLFEFGNTLLGGLELFLGGLELTLLGRDQIDEAISTDPPLLSIQSKCLDAVHGH
jgi:hypothetical protein